MAPKTPTAWCPRCQRGFKPSGLAAHLRSKPWHRRPPQRHYGDDRIPIEPGFEPVPMVEPHLPGVSTVRLHERLARPYIGPRLDLMPIGQLNTVPDADPKHG